MKIQQRIKNVNYFTRTDSSDLFQITDVGFQQSENGHRASSRIVDHYVLHFVLDGEGTYSIIDGESFKVRRGDCFVLLPDVAFFLQADYQLPYAYRWIGISGPDARKYMKQCGISEECPVVHSLDIDNISISLSFLQNIRNPGSMAASYFAIGTFFQILASIMKSNTDQSVSIQQRYIMQAVGIIHGRYYKALTIQSIADEIGIDRTYLFRIFKAQYGISLQEYLVQYRIQQACNMLLNTQQSLSNIAYYAGFSSSSYFSACFKNAMHVSPSEYRKNRLQKANERM